MIAGIVRAYATASLAEGKLRAAEQSVKSVAADLARSQTVLNAGMATDMDVLSIRVHLAAVQEERIRANADLDVARAVLNDAIGLPLDSAHQLTTKLDLTAKALAGSVANSQASHEEQATESRPEIRESHSRSNSRSRRTKPREMPASRRSLFIAPSKRTGRTFIKRAAPTGWSAWD